MNKKPLGIYVHIPFCESKCAYCDFLSGPQPIDIKKEYIEMLQKEIRSFEVCNNTYEVISIFFGGGTPSSIDAEDIKRVLECIYQQFQISDPARLEITIEANPGTLTKEKLLVYKEAGINRLSMGLQSTHNEELKLLGRIHTYEQFVENYMLAREVGFNNINVDLMSALPKQTKESYITTLERITELEPTHISAYSLIIEEDTLFYERYGEDKPGESLLPSEDEDREFYRLTKELLGANGYHRYEISNYAKDGKECIHNSLYWKGTDYLGFGLGASSYYQGKRYHNEEDLTLYMSEVEKGNCVVRDVNILSKEEQMEEMMFLGLRMMVGVKKNDFYKRFGVRMEDVYQSVIDKFQKEGLLQVSEETVALTEEGINLSNYVMAEFLLS